MGRLTLVGPTGENLVSNAEYFIDVIDEIPQRFYVVPRLRVECILGRPYLDKVAPLDVFAVDIIGEIKDGGKLRSLSTLEVEAEKAFLEEALTNRWVRPSSAQAAALIIFVPKKNGKLRACMDYRNLNAVTRRDKYPIPLLWDILHRAMPASYFTVLDGRHAFHRLRVRLGDESKLAFKTNQGMYEWLVMPFGVTNGPAYQQRFMDFVLRGHERYAACYIDDIIIWGYEWEDHLSNVEKVRDALRAHAIDVNEDKVQFAQEEVLFLGMKLSHSMVNANMDEELILNWPTPHSKLELQQFLGLANWFGPFAYSLTDASLPLYALTGNASWN